MPREITGLEIFLGLDLSAFDKGLKTASVSLRKLGTSLTKALTVPLLGAAAAALKFSADMEQAEIAFTNLLRSGTAAKKLLDELETFAASTPFQFDGLAQSAKLMLAFGFSAEDVLPTMRKVGDAVSAIGGGQEGITRVIRALGQMQAKGRVSAEEMQQIAELGIPAWELLADRIGLTIPEAMKAAEKGAIDVSKAVNALIDGMGERFEGMSAAQSKSLTGMASTLVDNMKMTARVLGDALLPIVKDIMPRIIESVKNVGTAFREMSSSTKTQLLVVAGILAATGPIMLGLSLILAHPIMAGAAVALAGLGLIIGKFIDWKRQSDLVRESLAGISKELKFQELVSRYKALKEEIGRVISEMEILKDLGGAIGDDSGIERRRERLQQLRMALGQVLEAQMKLQSVSGEQAAAPEAPGAPDAGTGLPSDQQLKDRLDAIRKADEEWLAGVIETSEAADKAQEDSVREFVEFYDEQRMRQVEIDRQAADQSVQAWENLSGRLGLLVADMAVSFRSMGKVFHSVMMGMVRDMIAAIAKAVILQAVTAFTNPTSAITLGARLASGIGKVFGFAGGGIVTSPTLAMIGEGGESEAVIPLSRLSSMMNNGPSHITVISQIDGREVARSAVEFIPNELTRQGIRRGF